MKEISSKQIKFNITIFSVSYPYPLGTVYIYSRPLVVVPQFTDALLVLFCSFFVCFIVMNNFYCYVFMTSKLFICNVYSAINSIQCIFYLSLVISRAWFGFSTFPDFLTTWNIVITVPVLLCANSNTWLNSGSFLIGWFFSSLCLRFSAYLQVW